MTGDGIADPAAASVEARRIAAERDARTDREWNDWIAANRHRPVRPLPGGGFGIE